MIFSHLLGNPSAKQELSILLERGKLPHVLLFTGPKGVGKSLFARALAEKLLRTLKGHPPDLHHYVPTGKALVHTVESVHQLQDEVALPPFEAPVKVFILEEAERMLPASSNALLKTLEEPPADSYFFLIAHEAEQILPTLLSRCTPIRFFPVPQEEIVQFLEQRFSVTQQEAKEIALRAQGSVGRACQLVEKRENRLALIVQEIFEKRNLGALQEVVTDEEEEDLFEEIALFFRAKKPEKLRALLPLIAEARLARERHMKLSAVLEYLLLSL